MPFGSRFTHLTCRYVSSRDGCGCLPAFARFTCDADDLRLRCYCYRTYRYRRLPRLLDYRTLPVRCGYATRLPHRLFTFVYPYRFCSTLRLRHRRVRLVTFALYGCGCRLRGTRTGYAHILRLLRLRDVLPLRLPDCALWITFAFTTLVRAYAVNGLTHTPRVHLLPALPPFTHVRSLRTLPAPPWLPVAIWFPQLILRALLLRCLRLYALIHFIFHTRLVTIRVLVGLDYRLLQRSFVTCRLPRYLVAVLIPTP